MQITNIHCSGQTVSLAAGDYHATIVTVGAGLAELTFQGCHLGKVRISGEILLG